MKNLDWKERIIVVGFLLSFFAAAANLLWDMAGANSPFYYNICFGIIFVTYSYFHGLRFYGPLRTNTLVVVTVIISFAAEYVGVKTGFPFGDYKYGEVLGPLFLDTVPYLIPFSWLLFLYPCLIITNELLYPASSLQDLMGKGGGAVKIGIFAFIDAVGLTVCDILIDPIWVHRKSWFWTGIDKLPAERLFYNIPVQNYFGWFFVSFFIFIIFRTVFFRTKKTYREKDNFYFLPLFVYMVSAVVANIEAWTILQNTALIFVALMTQGFFCLLSSHRILLFYRKI